MLYLASCPNVRLPILRVSLEAARHAQDVECAGVLESRVKPDQRIDGEFVVVAVLSSSFVR